jgi:hypothetical protein
LFISEADEPASADLASDKKVVDWACSVCYKEWDRKEEGNEFYFNSQKILLDCSNPTGYNGHLN